MLRVWFNGAEPRFVVISERSFAGKNASPNLLPDAATDVQRKVANILVGHAKFDGDHEDVVVRQIRFLECAYFLNNAPLKQAYDFSSVVEIASKAVKLPREYASGLSALDTTEHVVEDRSARLLGALALGERPHDAQPVLRRDQVQLGELGVDGEHLTVFVLGGFAAVYEEVV